MSQWQVLRWGRVSRAPLGHHVHHAAGVSVHYSTAAAAPASLDGSRSFCLSRDKHTLQQLNGRLATYLQQVQCLAAANQRLEHQIQAELDRKCPGELKELDKHLRRMFSLQDQISECLSAQAHVKLQLLNAELTALDFKMRSEQEREQRSRVEEELCDLRLLKEELRVNQLPELQSLLNDQTQQLVELQQQHQQDRKVLLGQMSGGVSVEMQTATSSDLIQQLDCLRQTSVALMDKNQDKSWFKTQVSRLSSPEVIYDASVESEVDQAELGELRRAAARLTEELTQQQMLITHLEAYGEEQTESSDLKLRVLQQTVDSLSRDLDSVLQATAKQAADHQTLLDVKNQLEAEIQDYRRLLDGMTHQGFSSPHIKYTSAAISGCVTTSPYESGRHNTADTVSVKEGNLRKMEVQTVSRGHVHTVGQTPVVAPLSETVTTVQSLRVHSNHQNNLLVTSANDSNLAHSFQKLEKKKAGVLAEAEMTKTIPCAEPDVKQEPHLETEPDPGKRTAAEVWTDVFNTEPNNLIADVDTGFNTASASQGIPHNNDNLESEITSTEFLKVDEEVVHDNKVESNNETVNVAADVSGCQEPNKVKVDSVESGKGLIWKPFDLPHKLSTSVIYSDVTLSFFDPETLLSSREADVPSPTEPATPEPAETPDDLKTYHRPNNSDTCVSPAEAKTLSNDKNIERKEKDREDESECILLVSSLDQSLALSTSTTDKSNSKPNKVMDYPDTANASLGGLDSSDNNESKTTSMETYKTKAAGVSVVSGFQDTCEAKAHPTEEDNESDGQEDQEASKLSISSLEECLSPQEADELMHPTKEVKSLSPEICMSPTETEVFLSMTDHVFSPVYPEDLLISQNQPKKVLSPSDPDTYLSPAEVTQYLSPNGEEEDEEACLSLTEANAHVKPVEKYILSTKEEEGQSLSFSGDQGLAEEDRYTNITGCATDKCKDSRSMADDVKKNDSQVVNKTVDSHREFGKPASTRCSNSKADFSSAAEKNFTCNRKEESSSDDSKLATSPPDTGRFKRRGSEEWMVYGSLGRKNNLDESDSLPNTESKVYQPADRNLTTSPPATGRIGSEGSGEWRVHGGSSGRLSSAGRTEQQQGGKEVRRDRDPNINRLQRRHLSSSAG
ncbi:uncharacterized protein LOC114439933 [Parambassis ranga]|uniref:Uncharacterized protein LOC114439933 n=1 Tax=Parambassis ranga TaxID=210632 RepID=A0A6P7II63_9TELE|nr:uncharacterized protein LOC114439933 [Parambassis ranga]